VNQAMSSKLSEQRLRKAECQICCAKTAEYSICDGWQNARFQNKLKTFLFGSLSTTAHRYCLLFCATEILLLTYLLINAQPFAIIIIVIIK